MTDIEAIAEQLMRAERDADAATLYAVIAKMLAASVSKRQSGAERA